MKVLGSHLERAISLVRQLQRLECASHSDRADVHLIVAQDGSVQCSPNIVCCHEFASTVRDVVEAHNAQFRA
jgi:hypothetical protein